MTMYLFTAHTTVQELCQSSRCRNEHRVLGVYLSFLVDTRFQLQAIFLDIFWSVSVLDEVEGEEVGVLCVLKRWGEREWGESQCVRNTDTFWSLIVLTSFHKKPVKNRICVKQKKN